MSHNNACFVQISPGCIIHRGCLGCWRDLSILMTKRGHQIMEADQAADNYDIHMSLSPSVGESCGGAGRTMPASAGGSWIGMRSCGTVEWWTHFSESVTPSRRGIAQPKFFKSSPITTLLLPTNIMPLSTVVYNAILNPLLTLLVWVNWSCVETNLSLAATLDILVTVFKKNSQF